MVVRTRDIKCTQDGCVSRVICVRMCALRCTKETRIKVYTHIARILSRSQETHVNTLDGKKSNSLSLTWSTYICNHCVDVSDVTACVVRYPQKRLNQNQKTRALVWFCRTFRYIRDARVHQSYILKGVSLARANRRTLSIKRPRARDDLI